MIHMCLFDKSLCVVLRIREFVPQY